ncbi:ATP-dependent DNA helicase RecG [Corynebacterium sp. ZY180755]
MLGWHDHRKLSSILPSKEASAIKRAFGFTEVEQLLGFYPRKYAAHGVGISFSGVMEDEMVTIIGEVVYCNSSYTKNGILLHKVGIRSQQGTIQASFFRARHIPNVLREGTLAMFTGKLQSFNGSWQLQHPDFIVLPRAAAVPGKRAKGTMGTLSAYGDADAIVEILAQMAFIPIYPAKKGMPTWRTLGAVHEVLRKTPEIPDPLGPYAPEDLPSFDQAMRGIHQPEACGPDPYIDRMRYNEAIEIASVMALRRSDAETNKAYAIEPRTGGMRQQLLENLPFALTSGQEEVLAEIAHDIAQPRPMSRLLQGEVGSGKTIVSVLAMMQVVDADKQCALLAPTEVLATQHARSIQDTLEAAGVEATVVLLTGSLNTQQRQHALLSIVSGEADIVVGTHAIIQEGVEFYDLGLSIVDEQHRFGVEQRNYLRSMGKEGTTPHLLVMTATPIPRTIAMTAFGDLSQSTLKQLPGGRKPIQSFVVSELKPEWLMRCFARINEEIDQGRQAYIVCHNIHGAGGVEETYEALSHGVFAHQRVAMLHGKMRPEEKDHIMREFGDGNINILISTTVIEVGIDVPNATVMMIRNSENFGVSQLHQLRGRVGRGGNASICFFHVAPDASEQSVQRIQAVADTNDGFELAEIDLEYRQEGDVLGAAQSGVSKRIKLLSLSRDRDVITRAHQDARTIASHDRELARSVVADIDEASQDYLDKS